MPRHALFIHGNWVTPAIWEPFQRRFSACGYRCSAPPWPAVEHDRHPGIHAMLDHYETLIRGLEQQPLLIGHDLGGLLVQMLLDRGLGKAGIAIDPLPPRAGLLGLYSCWRWLLAGYGGHHLLHMTPQQFARNMAQTLTPAQQSTAYARHVVPASRRVFVEVALGIGNAIDFSNSERAPLLLLAGNDAGTVAALYRRHRRSPAITHVKQFPGYSHWLIAEPGRERIADYSIEWAQNQVGRF